MQPRVVVFDIETSTWFGETGSSNPTDLSIAIVAAYDSTTDSYDSYLESELPRLWKLLERSDILVGFNSDHFDIPILNKYYPGDLSHMKSVDIMKEVHGVLGRRLKLDTLAEATLGEKKIGNGLQSLEWWKKGEVEKVREYCIKDVEITKRLFDYAVEKGSLFYKDLGVKREIRLDTSCWLSGGSAPLTQTLGF